jgi:hypothetical protein
MSSQMASGRRGSQQVATEQSLTQDTKFHLLQNARRRNVLRYLDENPENAESEIRAIALQLAAWENEKPPERLDASERQRVYISLYQTHLPKLADAGVINYNKPRGWVEPTPLATQLYSQLSSDSSEHSPALKATVDELVPDIAPVQYYGGVTVVSAVLIAASALGLLPSVITNSLDILIMALYSALTLVVLSR